MKTREELQEIVDSEFCKDFMYNPEIGQYIDMGIYYKIKYFYFETIIPEILKSIIPLEKIHPFVCDEHTVSYNNAIIYTKQKAQDLYGITL